MTKYRINISTNNHPYFRHNEFRRHFWLQLDMLAATMLFYSTAKEKQASTHQEASVKTSHTNGAVEKFGPSSLNSKNRVPVLLKYDINFQLFQGIRAMVNAQIPGKGLNLPCISWRNTTRRADLIMPPIKRRVCRGLAILASNWWQISSEANTQIYAETQQKSPQKSQQVPKVLFTVVSWHL